MRIWRVGSISMGASLLLLGIVLLISQISGLKMATIFIFWWPVILIILGAEILMYIYFSRKENPFIKYDFLSIIFVGFIGMFAIGFTLVSTTGILDKIEQWTTIENASGDLPELDYNIEKHIKRIVIHTGNQSIKIEDSALNELNVFGTYNAQSFKDRSAIINTEDYLAVKEKGDTLFLTLKDVYSMPQPFEAWVNLAITILVPANIAVEIEGSGNSVDLKARNIENDWLINNVTYMNLSVSNDANFSINTANIEQINYGEDHFQNEEKLLSETFTFGEGRHTISIQNTNQININEPL